MRQQRLNNLGVSVRELLESIPLVGVLLGSMAIALAGSELGFILGERRAKRPDFKGEAQVSSLTGAHLGLFAFILAFSFSMAAGQAESRKLLVLEEAIAIEDAYLKAGLLTLGRGNEIQEVLRDYTRLRIAALNTDGIQAFDERSEATLKQLWAEVHLLFVDGDFDKLDSLVEASTSSLIALNERRFAAGTNTRVPPVLWMTLYLLLALSMLGMGYFSGIKGERSPVANTALSISFSLLIFLIADLDRPLEGLTKPEQTLMIELSRRIE
jgi:hypothetical protein